MPLLADGSPAPRRTVAPPASDLAAREKHHLPPPSPLSSLQALPHPRSLARTDKNRRTTPRAARRAPRSRRSVKAPMSAPPPGAVILGTSTDWKEDEEHEVDGLQRKVKRYRMIKELYAATEKVVPGSSGGRKKKQKKK